MMTIDRCPITLSTGFTEYSPTGRRKLFNGKTVSPVLPYDASEQTAPTSEFVAHREHISLSGVQEKLSVLVDKGTIRLTRPGEQGTHILKPATSRLARANDIPANEHVTMQIASQVFRIETAANGLCFFHSGEPAYITKRFDLDKNGTKLRKEDFASLSEKSSASNDSKYDYSYEKIGHLIRRYIPSWRVSMEKFFRLVLFNYLFSNGDAHLKNFSILETPSGDMVLSPAYDLLNTSLHIRDSAFALSGGLFEGASDFVNKASFEEFGKRLGVQAARMQATFKRFSGSSAAVEDLIHRSYLSAPAKRAYLLSYRTRYNTLR